MICGTCGTEFEDGAAFCPKCGARVQPAEVPQAAPVPETAEPAPQGVAAPDQADTSAPQPYPQQPYGQPYPPAPYPQQPYAQPYPQRPYQPVDPSQPYGGQPYPQAPYPQPYPPADPSQPYGQPYPQAPYQPVDPSQPYGGQPYQQAPYQQPYPQPAPPAQAPEAAPAEAPSADAPATDAPAKRQIPLPVLIVGGIVLVVVGALIVTGVISFGESHVDDYGNPTVSAVVQQSGSQLCGMLEGEGWTWEDDNHWITSGDDKGHIFFKSVDDSDLDRNEVRNLGTFGGDTPVAFAIVVDDSIYKSAQETLDGLMDMDDVATEWISNDRALVYFKDSSGNDAIVLVMHNDYTNRYHLMVFNSAAIEQGVAEYWIGNDCGTSVDEIWGYYFDHAPNT